jgi:heterodisulfide reductase subunit A-like polyferredoxin
MMDVGRHPNIELFTMCEVIEAHGYVGNFEVRLRKHPNIQGMSLKIVHSAVTACIGAMFLLKTSST